MRHRLRGYLEDVERLARIVTAVRRPVQFVFAGRVDGTDDLGSHHLQRTFRQILDPTFGGRLAFVEDYDLHVARLMVQGCDVWLTMPSAEGGESLGAVKAAVNGVRHMGPSYASSYWWGFDDSRTLYRLLEDESVPAFYDRNRAGISERWTAIVRAVLAESIPRYTARHALIAAADQPTFTQV